MAAGLGGTDATTLRFALLLVSSGIAHLIRSPMPTIKPLLAA